MTMPALTHEESVMTRRVVKAEHVTLAFVLAYLHWARARGWMLDAMIGKGQLSLVGKEGKDA